MTIVVALALLVGLAVIAGLWYGLQHVGQDIQAHGLTLICPIRHGESSNESFDSLVRSRLQSLRTNERSPFAAVPDTYLCRAFVLDDVFYAQSPKYEYEHLRSKYLVFTANHHGDLDRYLHGMWNAANGAIREIWEYCVGFDEVVDARSFVEYARKCRVETTFFFNGSTDRPLDEQLKSLYLKQELALFAFQQQGRGAEEVQAAFREFVARTRPTEPHPRWVAGSASGEVTPAQAI